MKKILPAILIISFGLSAVAQVTKLSNNTRLNGFLLDGKPIFISKVDSTLWTTDGTPTGTKRYTTKVIDSGGGIVLKNKFYFPGKNSNGTELWVTDGTDAGTSLIKDINVGSVSSAPISFMSFDNNTFLFFAKTSNYGNELWKSDGTNSGTQLVKDINPGSNNSLASSSITPYAKLGNIIYFYANDGIHGLELWLTDGTADGTKMVKDINPGSGRGAGFSSLFLYNNIIIFTANDGTHGIELWKTDGTANRTQLLKDIYPGVNNSNAGDFKIVNNKTIFVANSNNESFSSDLWVTDGTSEGTKLLSANGPTFSFLVDNTIFADNKIIFKAYRPETGYELWATDGTSENTKLFDDIETGPSGSSPYFMSEYSSNQSIDTLWKGKAFLYAYDDAHGSEIWQTDGTSSGTKLFKDIFPGTESGLINSTSYFTKDAFFFMGKPNNDIGFELYKSDGTSDGTILVKDINPGPGSSDVGFLFVYKNQLYFSATDSDGGGDLFKLDAPVASLPVTLFDFAATLQPTQAVKLDWSTATEINSDHFEIERSFDGVSFNKITSVAAIGNSNAERKYSYIDEQTAHLGKQLLYYRLKMVDKDGSYKYSGVLPIYMNNLLTFSLSPNPVASQLNVLVNTRGSHNVSLRITDASGKYLYQKTLPVSEDVYQQSINVASLHRGVYYVQVVTDTQTKSAKFVKP